MRSRSVPGSVSSTSRVLAQRPRRRSSAATTSVSPPLRATTYVAFGFTATAVLDTRVHGVVVQTSSVRPGCRSSSVAAGDREPDVHRRVDDRLVALRDLVVGQAGPAARAVRA